MAAVRHQKASVLLSCLCVAVFCVRLYASSLTVGAAVRLRAHKQLVDQKRHQTLLFMIIYMHHVQEAACCVYSRDVFVHSQKLRETVFAMVEHMPTRANTRDRHQHAA